MNGDEGVRRLSDTEATFAYTHALMGGNTQLTTEFTVNAAFSPERVERAVELWLRRLPLLSLRIAELDGSLWFRRETPEAPSPEGRLWRLRVGHGPAAATRFAFTCHHAICDGYSTGHLVRAFLDGLFGIPGGDGFRPGADPLPPDIDELTYASGDMRPPRTPQARRSPCSYSARLTASAGSPVTFTLTPRESRRLRNWCRARELTVGGLLATGLADSLARETGREEVTVSTAVSLRRRYAERSLITEPGCVLGLVRTPARTGTGTGGNDQVDRARENAAALRSAAHAWRPARRAHARIRQSVEREAAGGGAPEIRVTDIGSVDAALGSHTARLTEFRTVAARGDAPAGGTLHLSSFMGALTVALSTGSKGPARLAAAAERAVREAVLLSASR
ncbi:hypothetical protein [Streptomyces sp. NPDC002156]